MSDSSFDVVDVIRRNFDRLVDSQSAGEEVSPPRLPRDGDVGVEDGVDHERMLNDDPQAAFIWQRRRR